MLNDITIGQYIPGNSPIHRLYAGVKIIFTIVYILLLFAIKKPISYLVFTVYTITLVMISQIKLRFILRGLKPVLWILIFTAVMNLFLTKGTSVFSVSFYKLSLNITYEGIIIASRLVLRLIYIVIISSLLTLTTPPLTLTDGIQQLMKPLEKIKVPSRDIAMMMSIAIRFIPTLSEEADKIIKAQKARGADFETGNIIKRAKAMLPILVPLFISVFRRADDLALAMEARCYNSQNERTKMNEEHIGKIDVEAGIIFLICAIILILAELIIEI